MYYRTKRAFSRGLQELTLRVRCWNLPPVATHLGCFLLGTLLFEPDHKGQLPRGILIPWTLQRIKGGLHFAADYSLISAHKNCLLSPETFKVWEAEEKKLYILINRSKKIDETISLILKPDSELSVKSAANLIHCEKPNVVFYP